MESTVANGIIWVLVWTAVAMSCTAFNWMNSFETVEIVSLSDMAKVLVMTSDTLGVETRLSMTSGAQVGVKWA